MSVPIAILAEAYGQAQLDMRGVLMLPGEHRLPQLEDTATLGCALVDLARLCGIEAGVHELSFSRLHSWGPVPRAMQLTTHGCSPEGVSRRERAVFQFEPEAWSDEDTIPTLVAKARILAMATQDVLVEGESRGPGSLFGKTPTTYTGTKPGWGTLIVTR